MAPKHPEGVGVNVLRLRVLLKGEDWRSHRLADSLLIDAPVTLLS